MMHTLADTILSFRLLKAGGLLIVDDMKSFLGVELAVTPVIKALEEEDCVEVLYNEVRRMTFVRSSAWQVQTGCR